jgi:transposase
MSTSPYSLDLRTKVIEYLKTGKSQKEASLIFGIHPNTISKWNVRKRNEGHCAAKTRPGKKGRVSTKDLEEFVTHNPDTNLKEIGAKFKISAWHSSRLLKKLGFSYKKKPFPTWKRRQKSDLNISI